MPSFTIAERIFAIAFSVTCTPLAGAAGAGGATVLVASLSMEILVRRPDTLRRRRLHSLLLLPVVNRRTDRVFREHRAVNLDRRQRKLFHDLGILDLQSLVHRLAFHPLSRQ